LTCATWVSSADLAAACVSAASGAVNVNAVTAPAVPKKPRRVVFPSGSSDMKHPFPAEESPLLSGRATTADGLSLWCEVGPKIVEALGPAEQGGEDGQVCQQDVAGARACRRHPKEHIEF